MKPFKKILQIVENYEDGGSSRMQYPKDERSEMERNIDEKISKLTDIDSMYRSDRKTKLPDREPLLYNMPALLALKKYYYGKQNPKEFPHYARRVSMYRQVLEDQIPHLLHHVDEP